MTRSVFDISSGQKAGPKVQPWRVPHVKSIVLALQIGLKRLRGHNPAADGISLSQGRTIPPGPVENTLDKMIADSFKVLILRWVVHYRYCGLAKRVPVNGRPSAAL